MMRQTSSVAKETSPTIGNCATDQITAIASSTQRVETVLTMKPTMMAEIENSRKNEEPSWPNCSASSLRSFMIGTPARPTTILSAKFTSMNRNRRKVIFQAPFGVGSAVIIGSLDQLACRNGLAAMLAMAVPIRQPGIFAGDMAILPGRVRRASCNPDQNGGHGGGSQWRITMTSAAARRP